MKITAKITSANNTWFPTWPKVPLAECYPGEPGNERFDENVFRSYIKDQPGVMVGSDDTGSPLALAAIIIQSVNDWLEDNDKGDDGKPGRDRARERLNKRLERGNVSYCSIQFTQHIVEHEGRRVRGVRIKITTDDAGVVETRKFEREFAMVLADFVRCYSARAVSRGEPPFVLTPETEVYLHELHDITSKVEHDEAVARINADRQACWRNRCGLCSPCRFDCVCNRAGRCADIPDDFAFPEDGEIVGPELQQ